MGIQITNQTNEQECGVCVLTSLHNHLYKENVGKEEVLDKSHINDGGMTVFDFEVLGSSLGLSCESYELTYVEFLNLKITNFFVLLLATNGSNNHYVIARKKKKYIEIYDSCSSIVKKLSYSELQKIFLNVLILVKKEPNKLFSKVFGKAKTLLIFDLKFILLNLLLSIVILATSVACASFLNYVIDMAISKSSINNLITISFIFVLFYFTNDIFLYVSNLYMTKHMKNYLLLFTNKILTSIQNKKLNFISKVDKNWIFKIDECVYNISNFCVVEANKFITNIIFCVVCICIIGSIQYYLLIFVLAYAIIELIFFLFSYQKKKEMFIDIVRSENNNANLYKNLIFSLSNELWLEKKKILIHKIKSNYSSIYKNYSNTILFKANSGLLKSLFKSICEICIVGLMSYLIIKTNELSIGKLTFVISAFGLLKNSCCDAFNYGLTKIEFNVYWQVYKDLTTVDNMEETKQFILDEKIKSLTFVNGNKIIKLDSSNNINKLCFSAIDLFKGEWKCLINNNQVSLNKDIYNKIIIINQTTSCCIDLLLKCIESSPIKYSQYLNYFNLNLNRLEQNFYETLIINILVLLNENNKIIFIDDLISFIKKQDLLVVKQILSKVRKNNTVFITGKEEND